MIIKWGAIMKIITKTIDNKEAKERNLKVLEKYLENEE